MVNLIFFVGGATYAEISALRFLAAVDDGGPKHEYVIGTTSIINGNSMMKNLSEKCKLE